MEILLKIVLVIVGICLVVDAFIKMGLALLELLFGIALIFLIFVF